MLARRGDPRGSKEAITDALRARRTGPWRDGDLEPHELLQIRALQVIEVRAADLDEVRVAHPRAS